MKEILADSAWTRFQRPLAIWADGQLFVGHFAIGGCWISQVDQAGEAQASYLLKATEQDDSHDTTTIGVRPDGRIIAAYSVKDEPSPRMYVRISQNPHDVSSWQAEQALTSGFDIISYANLVYLSSESRWYLFFRAGVLPDRQWAFLTSDDDGETWSNGGAPTHLTTDNGERPYLQIDSDGVSRIDISMSDGHPSEVPDNSIYHLYYQGGSWFTSDGTDLGALPFDHADLTLVWDGAIEKAWGWDTVSGANPRLLFDTDDGTGDKRYRYARWDGSQWQVTVVSEAGGSPGSREQDVGGIVFNRGDSGIVEFSREVAPGEFEIERMSTADDGQTWGNRESVTSGVVPPIKNIHPASARGSGPFRLLWMRGQYVDFQDTIFDAIGIYADLPAVTPPPESEPGLGQVATATIRNRLTWLSCNLSDGAVITELPDLQGDEVSRVIGEYTSANLSLPIPAVGGRDLTLAQRAALAIQSTQPPRTKIVAVVNDVPAWEGIPLPRDLGTDAAIPLGCVSMEGYLRHVYIGDHTFNEQDVALIADGILRDAVTTPHGPGVALVIDAPNIGTIASRAYLDIDNQTVYAGLQELMKAGLMEWTLQPDWRMGMAYRVVDTIARVRGQLGKSEPTAVFQSATFSSQGASDARYQLKEDYGDDRYANVVRLHGAGEGDDQLRSAPAIDQAQIDSGVPVWELRASAPQNVEQQALLDLHAERRLDRVRDGAHSLEITARWDAPGARLGVDWSVGDLVRHELVGHAHPNGFNGVRRAIGFALSIQRGTIRPILQEELE